MTSDTSLSFLSFLFQQTNKRSSFGCSFCVIIRFSADMCRGERLALSVTLRAPPLPEGEAKGGRKEFLRNKRWGRASACPAPMRDFCAGKSHQKRLGARMARAQVPPDPSARTSLLLLGAVGSVPSSVWQVPSHRRAGNSPRGAGLPSPSACGCHLSRRGEASCCRRRGPGLCLPALPCFRRTSRRRGPGKPPRLCHSVSPAILGTFGAQKSRMGAGHADVLPYHSCRRHTARFLPPSRYACYLPHQREALCTGRRPILQFLQGNHFTHQYQGP